ncbi:hypothetical protein JXL21_12840 [Candidatus Bathyarchaeota archaeon]|nr:hypothetical protein [Candidatus Bathyarchaeota archaeon]
MEQQRLVRACPFPPGVSKPRVEHVPRRWGRTLSRVVSLRSMVLVMALVAVTYLYVDSYVIVNTTGTPVLFRDNYVLLLSLGSYVSIMVTWYIRRWKMKRRRER